MLANMDMDMDHKRKRFRAPDEVLRADALRRAPATWTPPTADRGWHIFPLQDQAFAFADAEANSSKEKRSCWAEELDGSGRRRYVVASRVDFWQRYRNLRCDAPRDAASPAAAASPACSRHYYEIIREGNPCHLHLDLEFATASNLAADGERMVATLRHELLGALVANFGVVAADCEVVDLESSTVAKFSRHVLLRVRGAAFADNAHCGRFVSACCAALHARSTEEAQLAELFVNPPAPHAAHIDRPRHPASIYCCTERVIENDG